MPLHGPRRHALITDNRNARVLEQPRSLSRSIRVVNHLRCSGYRRSQSPTRMLPALRRPAWISASSRRMISNIAGSAGATAATRAPATAFATASCAVGVGDADGQAVGAAAPAGVAERDVVGT